MQYRLATGANVINLLAASGLAGGTTGPLSASGSPNMTVSAYTVASPQGWNETYNTQATLTTSAGTNGNQAYLNQIYVGSYIAMELDYTVGTYGSALSDAGVPVYQNAVTDIDYYRKNTDYVARVTAVNGTTLTLDQPFVGGGSGNPTSVFNYLTGTGATGMKIVPIKGFAAREGGTFIAEYSCLLMNNTVDGAQLVIYYPHCSIMQNRDVAAAWTIENAGTTDESGFQLDAQFAALAFDDPLDGETVVAYKAYYYRSGENAAI